MKFMTANFISGNLSLANIFLIYHNSFNVSASIFFYFSLFGDFHSKVLARVLYVE